MSIILHYDGARAVLELVCGARLFCCWVASFLCKRWTCCVSMKWGRANVAYFSKRSYQTSVLCIPYQCSILAKQTVDTSILRELHSWGQPACTRLRFLTLSPTWRRQCSQCQPLAGRPWFMFWAAIAQSSPSLAGWGVWPPPPPLSTFLLLALHYSRCIRTS